MRLSRFYTRSCLIAKVFAISATSHLLARTSNVVREINVMTYVMREYYEVQFGRFNAVYPVGKLPRRTTTTTTLKEKSCSKCLFTFDDVGLALSDGENIMRRSIGQDNWNAGMIAILRSYCQLPGVFALGEFFYSFPCIV